MKLFYGEIKTCIYIIILLYIYIIYILYIYIFILTVFEKVFVGLYHSFIAIFLSSKIANTALFDLVSKIKFNL